MIVDPNFAAITAKLSENEKDQAGYNAIAKALDDAALKEALDPKNAEAQRATWDERTRRLKGRYD